MRIPPLIRDALDTSGLPWEIKEGGRHYKIVVGGKCVGILPYGKTQSADMRSAKNLVAQIRRRVEEEQ